MSAKRNPLHRKGPIGRGISQITGRTAKRKAAREQSAFQERSDRESAAFSASQQESRDRLAREESEKVRAGRRRGSRRSLLAGDERGVGESGKRPVTG